MRFAINASVRAAALAGAFVLSACAGVGGSPDGTGGSTSGSGGTNDGSGGTSTGGKGGATA
jgi:hypothetical protein